jgi:hypothetical protein
MADTTVGGSLVRGAASASFSLSRGEAFRLFVGLLILVSAIGIAYGLFGTPQYGSKPSFSLLTGLAFGVIMERGRFCFFCILRDYIENRNSGGMFAIITALAVGGIGYAVIFGAFLPNPLSGRLPPDAHIGPVSWVLVAAGVAFGVGMALSGACISGHLYRLGEGYTRAPFALIGALIGFGLGFFSWQTLYLGTINKAPIAWLPATFGYGGSLALHLTVLSVLGVLLLRRLPPLQPHEGGNVTLRSLYNGVFHDRWNPLVTGGLVGILGMFAYFRVEPLGVTSQLGSIARTVLENGGLLAERLNGLDTFAGCATQVIQTITENGWLIIGIVIGSFAVSLIAKKFQPAPLTVRGTSTALLGGVLMGWGSMLALGCTVGVLLSGISAFALAGWVFAGSMFVGVWLGIKLKLHS